jgi:hypothetical protein
VTDGRIVRIGGASGMWGDSAIATPQLLSVEGLNYLSYDYLAETTMAILARAKARDATAGFATDFVTAALADHLPRIAEQRVKVLSNAGGLNPGACRAAVQALADRHGLDLRIAVVSGDDVLAVARELGAAGHVDLEGRPLPARLGSANAYLGARAVHRALELGADLVITGRVVDSAFVVAALVHEFGWAWDDWDRLAQATLAGHVIECGAQATGGLFTDWRDVPGWDEIGYPVVECRADASFVVTKPPATGGLVVAPAVAEQIVYEIGDPAAYVMPDVTVDLRGVQVKAVDGGGRVEVTGARGTPPPREYRVSATVEEGFRLDVLLAIRGRDACAKAEKTADALLRRTRRLMAAHGHGDYGDVLVELLGAEALYGPHSRARETREVVLRMAVNHAERAALEFLRREVTSPGTSMGPGTRGHFGGRSEIQPLVRLCSFQIDKTLVVPVVDLGSERVQIRDSGFAVRPPSSGLARSAAADDASRREGGGSATATGGSAADGLVTVTLAHLAYARSGDKGDTSNIGVVARGPEAWAWLRENLTATDVARYFAHLVRGPVVRYELPGLMALNFVLCHALGGGGTASLRSDPLGKSFAQMLLDMPIRIPPAL